MPKGVAHSAEVRAQAEALLLEGHSQADVCRLTGLPRQTVSRLAQHISDELGGVGTLKKQSALDLIVEYLEKGLRAMIVQAEVFGDPDYCRAQSANDLAIAHGILGDKLAGIAPTAKALGLIGAPPDAPETLALEPGADEA